MYEEDIKQLMTFDEVNTRIHQPMEHLNIHRGIRKLLTTNFSLMILKMLRKRVFIGFVY